MSKKIKRYLMKQMTGRSRAARTLDAVLGTAFAFIIFMLLFWQLGAGVYRSALLAGCAAALIRVFSVWRSNCKLEKYVDKSISKLRSSLTIEHFLLSSKRDEYIVRCLERETGGKSFSKCGGGYSDCEMFAAALFNYPKQPVNEQQLFEAYSMAKRSGASEVCVLCAADFSAGARELAQRRNIKLIGKGAVLSILKGTELEANEAEALHALEAQAKVRLTREQFKKKVLNRGKTKAYALCAVLLTGWSFVVGFSIVYPLMASMCVAMAFYSYASEAAEAK